MCCKLAYCFSNSANAAFAAGRKRTYDISGQAGMIRLTEIKMIWVWENKFQETKLNWLHHLFYKRKENYWYCVCKIFWYAQTDASAAQITNGLSIQTRQYNK